MRRSACSGHAACPLVHFTSRGDHSILVLRNKTRITTTTTMNQRPCVWVLQCCASEYLEVPQLCKHTMALEPRQASCVDHVLGTIEALACHFNSSGSDFVESLELHTLEEQAEVISSILDSLTTAYKHSPEPGEVTAERAPSEWNTWLTASACARPSSLSGRKFGRRAPKALPGSYSVWWHGGTKCVPLTYWIHDALLIMCALFMLLSDQRKMHLWFSVSCQSIHHFPHAAAEHQCTQKGTDILLK